MPTPGYLGVALRKPSVWKLPPGRTSCPSERLWAVMWGRQAHRGRGAPAGQQAPGQLPGQSLNFCKHRTSDSGAAGGGRGLDPKQAHHVAACRTQSSCHPASKTKVGPLPSECPTQPACVPWPVAASRKITQVGPSPQLPRPEARMVLRVEGWEALWNDAPPCPRHRRARVTCPSSLSCHCMATACCRARF